MYYLIDLERSVRSGFTHYWRRNKQGYTRQIDEAGTYPKTTALEIVDNDYDQQTVMVHESVVSRILKTSLPI